MTKNEKWVITGINRLTNRREEITGPMTMEQVEKLLLRENDNRAFQKFKPYSRLRIEKVLPVQLFLNFDEQ